MNTNKLSDALFSAFGEIRDEYLDSAELSMQKSAPAKRKTPFPSWVKALAYSAAVLATVFLCAAIVRFIGPETPITSNPPSNSSFEANGFKLISIESTLEGLSARIDSYDDESKNIGVTWINNSGISLSFSRRSYSIEKYIDGQWSTECFERPPIKDYGTPTIFPDKQENSSPDNVGTLYLWSDTITSGLYKIEKKFSREYIITIIFELTVSESSKKPISVSVAGQIKTGDTYYYIVSLLHSGGWKIGKNKYLWELEGNSELIIIFTVYDNASSDDLGAEEIQIIDPITLSSAEQVHADVATINEIVSTTGRYGYKLGTSYSWMTDAGSKLYAFPYFDESSNTNRYRTQVADLSSSNNVIQNFKIGNTYEEIKDFMGYDGFYEGTNLIWYCWELSDGQIFTVLFSTNIDNRPQYATSAVLSTKSGLVIKEW